MIKNGYSIELAKKYWKQITVNVMILLIITALSVTGPLLLRNIMNSTNTGFDRQNIVLYFIILLFLYIFKFIYNRFKFSFAEKFKNKETVNLYKKIFRMQYEKINHLEPTYISERVTSTIDTVFGLYASSLTGIFVSALTMLVTLFIVFHINKTLCLLFFIQIPLQYFGFQKLLNGENSKLVKYGTELQETRAKNNKNIKALLADVNGIKQYGDKGKISELIETNIKDTNLVEKKGNRYAMDICTVLECCSVFLKNASYLLIIYMYIMKKVSVGDLVYLNLVNDIYYGSIGDVINIQINLRNLKGSLRFVSEEIESNYEENGERQLEEVRTIDGNLENIGYGEKILIDGGAFHIMKGDVVGVMGESGCGKTTFVKLLNKFVKGGKIYINNCDIMEYENASLRKRILYLPQNTYLLPCSVKDNIMIGDCESDNRWDELIKMDFMSRLIEGGLEKIVLENAANLSGGDRQKIILGRIFIQNPDVIILDESFNAIDEETGENLFETLKELYVDKIIIMISHSSRYIDKCNKIILIENRQLIQRQ